MTDVAMRGPRTHGRQGRRHRVQHGWHPYFQAANKSLGLAGRQILIATIERIVQFNILEFYRGQHSYVGIDTLGCRQPRPVRC